MHRLPLSLSPLAPLPLNPRLAISPRSHWTSAHAPNAITPYHHLLLLVLLNSNRLLCGAFCRQPCRQHFASRVAHAGSACHRMPRLASPARSRPTRPSTITCNHLCHRVVGSEAPFRSSRPPATMRFDLRAPFRLAGEACYNRNYQFAGVVLPRHSLGAIQRAHDPGVESGAFASLPLPLHLELNLAP